jgi:NADH dehydrogenase
MVAQPALQQAENLAANLLRLAKQQEPKPFKYVDKGNMATVGRNKAVAEIGKLNLGGGIAWYVWMAVHILFLIGFRNRMAVLFNWAVKYFSYKNTIRLIVRPFQRVKA